MSADDFKLQAARHALALVEPGMKLGLGTGSTAAKFVDLLGQAVAAGLDVICVPTSEATAAQARALGIKLTTLDECTQLDLTVDGADELTEDLALVKGGGGALLREKIVAYASNRLVIVADTSKRVQTLGRFPLPIEVVRFGSGATHRSIAEVAPAAGCTGEIRLRLGRDGQPFVTDGGNYIFDCHFGAIEDPDGLELILKMIPGIVTTGLFLGMAERAIIAGPDGVEELESPDYSDLLDDEVGNDDA